jgi:ABC-2 type transport system ATP-binding protein
VATIAVRGLTKRFGATLAVDELSFDVRPGAVTGFLGGNGAGKTTTLRMLLGLVAPTAGVATIDGRAYRRLTGPSRTVGAVLEGGGFHPGRSGRDHLRVLATASGVPPGRADALLELAGIAHVGRRRVGGYSQGMGQRLGLAAALLGDPPVLILDEPANGLDPQGIRWLRDLLRALARQGRTVLVSSHVLSEVAQTVDDVVVIGGGRLLAAAPLTDLLRRASAAVRVRTGDPIRLRQALDRHGLRAAEQDGAVLVRDATADKVSEIAAGAGLAIHEIAAVTATLEDVFLELTGGQEGR